MKPFMQRGTADDRLIVLYTTSEELARLFSSSPSELAVSRCHP